MDDFITGLSNILFAHTGTKELPAERTVELEAEIAPFVLEASRKELMAEIWHKSENHPDNRHPYPVINPDTKEMAFAYYDKILSRWVFDSNYNPGRNMLWMDIEKILPKED